ncbi:TetR/AcrR family transcriptional regulator [Corynebacterium ulcerans]|nr:TetR/AcrR family transcriptional regulator [Corynebacterium ulcerans]NON16703.1 TetR/AcrR family transcriptional regulator [Corynebacterium ulcerans]
MENMGSREENREKTQAAILDAAEALLREGGVEALTAGAVAQRVGLARNSLYRYVESMDELRGRVILRHFPDYVDAINQAIHEATTPTEALCAYITTNVQIVAVENHGWLMELAQGVGGEAEANIAHIHHQLIKSLSNLLIPFDLDNPALAAALIQGLLSTGFSALERGHDVQEVTALCVQGALGIVGKPQ